MEGASEEHPTSLAVGVTFAAAAEGGTGGCDEALRRGITQVNSDILRSQEEHGHSAQTRRAGGVGLRPSRRAQEGNLVDDAKSENASSVENLESMPRDPRNIAEKIPMAFPPASIFEDFTSASQRMGMYRGDVTVVFPREECPQEALWGRGGFGAKETSDMAEASPTDRRECHRLTEHEVSGRVTTASAEATRRHDVHGSRESASVRKFDGVPGEGEMFRTPSIEGFGHDQGIYGAQATDEKSTKMEPITAEEMVEPRAVVTEPERHSALLQEYAGTKLEVPRQVLAQEQEEEEEVINVNISQIAAYIRPLNKQKGDDPSSGPRFLFLPTREIYIYIYIRLCEAVGKNACVALNPFYPLAS